MNISQYKKIEGASLHENQTVSYAPVQTQFRVANCLVTFCFVLLLLDRVAQERSRKPVCSTWNSKVGAYYYYSYDKMACMYGEKIYDMD